MSPEAGLAIILTLLVGPTAIWLAYLAIRGNQGRYGESFLAGSASSDGAQTTTNQTEELIAEGFWICGTCRSMNRRGAKLCYACRTAPASEEEPAPEEQAPNELPIRGVPVMAEGIARPPNKVLVAAVAHPKGRSADAAVADAKPDELPARGVPEPADSIAPEPADSIAPPPDKAPEAPATRPRRRRTDAAVAHAKPDELPARGVPEPADSIAAPPDKAPEAPATRPRRRRTDVAAAAAATAAAADIPVRGPEPEHAPSAAPRQASAGASVCPFLGLVNDPATWCGYPDPRNVCHAAPARDETSRWSAAQLLIDRFAGRQSQPIAAEHQGSMCLTAAHEQCARYSADDATPAGR